MYLNETNLKWRLIKDFLYLMTYKNIYNNKNELQSIFRARNKILSKALLLCCWNGKKKKTKNTKKKKNINKNLCNICTYIYI